jgi:hypothetical protein
MPPSRKNVSAFEVIHESTEDAPAVILEEDAVSVQDGRTGGGGGGTTTGLTVTVVGQVTLEVEFVAVIV